MYTEDEYEQRGFPFREFLLRFILIVIIIFLLVWLLSKFITPKTDNKKVESTTTSEQLFQENLEKMKDAAISYYTEEKLPKEVGESDTMTLNQMIDKKLLTQLFDKKGKKCDGKESYVKITKLDNEYLLKVNLKTSTKEDYILVYLGCYSHCESYICEKNETTTNNSISNISPIISIIPTITNIEKNLNTNTNTGGNTEDNNKEGEDKTSSDTESDSNISNNDPINPPTDNTENNNQSSTDNNETSTPEEKPSYLYEYKKVVSPTFSSWSAWSSWEKTSCNTKAISCDDSSESCLKKLQRYDRQEQIGTYQKAYVKQKTSIVQTGSYQQKTCSNYNYVIINSTTYATSTTTSYSTVNNISSTTQSSTGNWKYIGRYEYQNPPRDTVDTHYEFVGANYNNCTSTCTTLPNYYYDKYQLTGSINQVSTTTTPVTTSTSSSKVSATCGSYVTKTVPIYSTIITYDKAYRTEPLYGTVCYQSTKTRTLKTAGKTYTKWSSYNDKTLLNNGWKYTGNTKKK